MQAFALSALNTSVPTTRTPMQASAAANAEFVRALEFCNRLGCRFVGTFSGGMPGASMEDQAKAFADVFNEKYLPVCEKLNVTMRWENYPNGGDFASTPAAMQAVFDLVPSKRPGLEFDPSKTLTDSCLEWDRVGAFGGQEREVCETLLVDHEKGYRGDL